MYDVLLVSINYPDIYHAWAQWNRNANLAISKLPDVRVEIVVPRPLSLPIKYLPYNEMCRIPAMRQSEEGLVHYPRFPYLVPKKLLYGVTGDLYGYCVSRYVYGHISKKDLVHCHHIYPDAYGMLGLCEKWRVPLVGDIHGDSFFTDYAGDTGLGRRIRRTVHACSKIVCVSHHIRELALRAGVDDAKLAFVPLGIDTGRFRPRDREQIRREMGIKEHHIVLYVGQLLRKKGLYDLLEAISLLTDRNDCKFVIIGSGPEEEGLRRRARRLGIEGQVQFEGQRLGEALSKWYSLANVFVLPSWTEGRPTVIYEAMASGCAVVATDVSGIPEQVKDGYTGLLVRPKDPVMLAEKLALLLDSGEKMTEMGQNGRKRILEEDWTWEGYARKIDRVYTSVL
ncbi:putative glycosyltransferase [Methanocella paludicola SANAE]|uniref:Glycosyltransferase n=1 Tax=Methanocella paludicola (strain DSM 17711 / JCM 13418 / NBRC 101707 / SANAE) TaxID=304371 RepID=D1Z1N8_METPS|nr:glycosyltransferase family 4 protein [Methanocella paludicola]BAI62610.1 putative glycosyltransferase [Methanocella paludicola SANAE]